MDDTTIHAHIEALVAEEHELLDHASGTGLDEAQHERAAAIKVELDRYWDLLRQRRAREEFGLDPEFVGIRDASTVENFKQ